MISFSSIGIFDAITVIYTFATLLQKYSPKLANGRYEAMGLLYILHYFILRLTYEAFQPSGIAEVLDDLSIN